MFSLRLPPFEVLAADARGSLMSLGREQARKQRGPLIFPRKASGLELVKDSARPRRVGYSWSLTPQPGIAGT